MIPTLLKSKERHNYKFLLENTDSGICVASLTGEIVDCNEIFISLYGCNNYEHILQSNINDFFTTPAGKAFTFENIKEESQSLQFYLQMKSMLNGKKACFVSANFIELSNKKHLLLNIIDINNQKYHQVKKTEDKDKQIATLKKKLLQSEKEFQRVLELSDTAICIFDHKRNLFVNPSWIKLTGFSTEEALEQKPWEYIHPDFKKIVKNRFIANLDDKDAPEKFDFKIQTKDNKVLWLCAKLGIVNHEGKHAVMASYQDVTNQKNNQQALKESKKKFQSLFYENNSIMFVVEPKTGNIVDANEAACKFYGYPKGKIITLNLKDISALSEEEINLQVEGAMQGKKEHSLFKHKLSNNEIRDVEVYSGKVEINETILLYSVVHDITVRKKAQEALRKSEQKLKELNAQKDKFFSIIAHDLRGPLGTFMQMTEYIKESFDELSSEEFKNYFSHLYTSSKSTFKLLENLLIWTRSQLGVIELRPEQINIKESIDEIVTLYKGSALAKNIELKNLSGEKLKAFADENTVATVLRNLISNAIKFTPENGSVKIEATTMGKDGKKFVKLSVIDDGVGIPEDKMDKLFSIADNHSTFGTNNEKGTGLGLILCRELVVKNGGEIWLESRKGKGSKFFFTLPENSN